MSRSFDFFADQVFEESLFKIRYFAQLLAGSFFLVTAVYKSNNGFDAPIASEKVELKAGDELFDCVCVSAFTLCSGESKPTGISL